MDKATAQDGWTAAPHRICQQSSFSCQRNQWCRTGGGGGGGRGGNCPPTFESGGAVPPHFLDMFAP